MFRRESVWTYVFRRESVWTYVFRRESTQPSKLQTERRSLRTGSCTGPCVWHTFVEYSQRARGRMCLACGHMCLEERARSPQSCKRNGDRCVLRAVKVLVFGTRGQVCKGFAHLMGFFVLVVVHSLSITANNVFHKCHRFPCSSICYFVNFYLTFHQSVFAYLLQYHVSFGPHILFSYTVRRAPVVT